MMADLKQNQIKYNGIVYTVLAKGENKDWNYESIVITDTGKRVVNHQRQIARKFIELNGETPNASCATTHVWIRQLLKILKEKANPIREYDENNSTFVAQSSTKQIDYLCMFDFVRDYADKIYSAKPDYLFSKGTITQDELDQIKQAAIKGNKAINELDSLAKLLAEAYSAITGDVLVKSGSNKYAKQNVYVKTGSQVRRYLWYKLVDSNFKYLPFSLSIFIETNNNGEQRVRVCIEMNNSGYNDAVDTKSNKYDADFADKAIKAKKRFDELRDISFDPSLSKVSGSNENDDIVDSVSASSNDQKVQISKIVTRNNNLTSDDYTEELESGFELLIPYYEYVIGKTNTGNNFVTTTSNEDKEVNDMNHKIGLNTILYGPPGTGKTYNTKRYVVAICDSKTLDDVEKMDYKTEVSSRYDELVKEGRVRFTTFHQSYGYEEFIEGIKPMVDDDNNVIYSVVPGLFKQFCDDARINSKELSSLGVDSNASIWKMSLYGGKTDIKKECYEEGYVRIGFDMDSTDGSMNVFKNKMQIGDIVLSLKSFYEIDGIGIIEGDVEELDNKSEFKVARKIKWLIKDKLMNIKEINGGNRLAIKTCSGLPNISRSGVMELITNNTETELDKEAKPYVFIIDEINRGNISKIFGELITLIEPTKRLGNGEAMEAVLPYSGEKFGVPNNVFILGTMNTADRSISLMDTALRRRFDFLEMMPDSKIVENISIQGINVQKMLVAINERISVLYDREHTIGHAFFTGLDTNSTIDDLALIFKNKVIPLLQEYFYEDYGKIRLVLGDNGKADEKYQFVKEIDNTKKKIFKGNYDPDIVENVSYELNDEALMEPESYIQIYN